MVRKAPDWLPQLQLKTRKAKCDPPKRVRLARRASERGLAVVVRDAFVDDTEPVGGVTGADPVLSVLLCPWFMGKSLPYSRKVR